MEKSHWPQAWKDEYNTEIRKRKSEKLTITGRERLKDQIYFPRINKMKIDEESIYAMLAYCFPLNPVISRILQRFISNTHMKELILSPRYLFSTQKMCPKYYSDRERIVAIMNRYRVQGNIYEFINLVQFQSDKSTFHYIHLLIGIIFLNHYIDGSSYKDECLLISIRHLEKANRNFEREDSKLTTKSLIAFAYYLFRDFERAGTYLNPTNNNLENDFLELIKKVA